MNYKFDVFISYKHAPLDRAVAGKLQKKLERYRISRDIQKKTGKKKINRVFRDEEELSVGHDLSEEIEEQLKQTEFLVVICSPASKQSIWVKREIDTFLKYHSASRILPLLIEGEPEEAFPENLMSLGEPFAADIREKTQAKVLKRLDKELDRIIAPVLHCSYDELKQRQKRYRMQRLATALSLAFLLVAGFLAYALLQNQKITAAYRDQLVTESKFLISDAEKLYGEGDYYGALKALVKALPSKELDRPLLPEAQYALTQDLGLYKVPPAYRSKLQSEGLISQPTGLENQLFVDSGGQYLLAHDRSHLYVYDALNMAPLYSLKTDHSIMDEIPNANLSEDGLIYFSDSYAVYCYNFRENTLVWKTSTPGNIRLTILSNDEEHVFVVTDNGLILLNNADGSFVERHYFSLKSTESLSDKQYTYSQTTDGETFAFTLENREDNTLTYQVYDHALKLKSSISVSVPDTSYHSMTLMDSDHMVTNYYDYEKKLTRLEGIELSTKKSLWTKEFTAKNHSDLLTRLSNHEAYASSCIYCYDSQALLFNGLTGETYWLNDLDSQGKYILSSKESVGLITQKGSITIFDETGEPSYPIKGFDESFSAFCKTDGEFTFYVIEEETKIVKYVLEKSDSSLIVVGPCENSSDLNYNATIKPAGTGFLGLTSEKIYYVNENHKLIDYAHELPISNYDFGRMDFNEDGLLEVLYKDNSTNNPDGENPSEALRFAIVDPEKRKILSDEVIYENDYILDSELEYENHTLVFEQTEDSETVIHMINTLTKETEEFSLYLNPFEDFSYSFMMWLSPDAKYLTIMNKDSLYLYLVDLSSKSIISQMDLASLSRDYLENISNSSYSDNDWIIWDKGAKYFAYSSENEIFIYDTKGNLIQQISYTEDNDEKDLPLCRFSPGGSYFYYSYGGELYEYSMKEGALTNQVTLKSEALTEAQWQFSANHLYLLEGHTLYIINTDKEAFGLLAKIDNCLCFNTDSNEAYVDYYGEEGCLVGFFKEYELEDILEMANKELNGKEENHEEEEN